MQLKDYIKIERAAQISNSEVGRLGAAIIFIVGVMLFTGAKFAHIEQILSADRCGGHRGLYGDEYWCQ